MEYPVEVDGVGPVEYPVEVDGVGPVEYPVEVEGVELDVWLGLGMRVMVRP